MLGSGLARRRGSASGGGSCCGCSGSNDLALVVPFQMGLSVAACFATTACEAWGVVGRGGGFAAISRIGDGVTIGEFGFVLFRMAEAWDTPFGLLLRWVEVRHLSGCRD